MPSERTTRQRRAIREALRHAKRPLSTIEILDAARGEVEGLGLATVYRTIKLMVAEGEIEAVRLGGESPRYEGARSHHHHHFQCVACRRVFDTVGCPGDLRRLAPRGFRVDDHEVTLYGCCADCGRAEAHAAR